MRTPQRPQPVFTPNRVCVHLYSILLLLVHILSLAQFAVQLDTNWSSTQQALQLFLVFSLIQLSMNCSFQLILSLGKLNTSWFTNILVFLNLSPFVLKSPMSHIILHFHCLTYNIIILHQKMG